MEGWVGVVKVGIVLGCLSCFRGCVHDFFLSFRGFVLGLRRERTVTYFLFSTGFTRRAADDEDVF
jgi:hypothetical protein